MRMTPPAAVRKDPAEPEVSAALEPMRAASGSVAEAAPGADRWPAALVVTAVAIAGILGIFSQTALTMLDKWWSVGTYGHGFLIVPVTLYLIWRRSEILAQIPPTPQLLGLAPLAGAAVVWFAGDVAAIQVVKQLALVTMICAALLTILGLPVIRRMLFPLAFLFFAVPIGDFMIPPLQDSTATLAVRFLQVTGIPVYIDGLMIHIPSGRFYVAETCSGVRFLISTLALASLGAYFFFQSWWRRLFFMAMAFVVPVVANGIRAYGIVMIAHLSDHKLAVGMDHLVYGWVFLSLITLCLIGIGLALREPEPDPEVEKAAAAAEGRRLRERGRPLPFAAAGALVLAVAVAMPAYTVALTRTVSSDTVAALAPPAVAPPWSPVESDPDGWQPVFYEPDATMRQTYAAATEQADLFVALYGSQGQDAEVVNENHRVGGAGWRILGSGSASARVDGAPLTVRTLNVRRLDQQRLVWLWYWVDGTYTSNRLMAKALEVRAKLLGGETAAAAVIVSAPYHDDPAESAPVLQSFLDSVGSLGAVLEAGARSGDGQ